MSGDGPYICINVYRLNISFSKKYTVESKDKLEKDDVLQKIVIEKEKGDIVKVAHYIKPPMARFVCLPRKKWLEYRRKAREELREKYKVVTETMIRDRAIEIILDELKEDGENA